MTPEQQIEALRRMGRSGVARRLKQGSLVLAVGLAIAGVLTGHPVFFMAGAFAGLVAFSARQTTPHILRATQALDGGRRSEGTVQIEVTHWSDSDTYHAVVWADASRAWRFEFIPLGWQPRAGAFPAVLFALPSAEWPALVRVDEGIFHPRSDPERVAT